MQINSESILIKYDQLFIRRHLDMTKTEMCWKLQIGNGWLSIIDNLCSNIQKMIDDKQLEKFEFECIKEKYGSLRLTGYPMAKEIQKLFRIAENKSTNTCEKCSTVISHYYDESEFGTEDDVKETSYYNEYNTLCTTCTNNL